jgi:hypothetical protein
MGVLRGGYIIVAKIHAADTIISACRHGVHIFCNTGAYLHIQSVRIPALRGQRWHWLTPLYLRSDEHRQARNGSGG